MSTERRTCTQGNGNVERILVERFRAWHSCDNVDTYKARWLEKFPRDFKSGETYQITGFAFLKAGKVKGRITDSFL